MRRGRFGRRPLSPLERDELDECAERDESAEREKAGAAAAH